MRGWVSPLDEARNAPILISVRCCSLSVALLAGLLAGCERRAATPAPTFELVFPPVPCEFLSNSSPALIDLNGDDVADIVFGSGVDRIQPKDGALVFGAEPAVPGYVTAVSGADNTLLWKAPHPGEAFTTPRFADLNRDGVPDVVMGGREGAFGAYSGRDGALLWRAAPASVAATAVTYNFHTPAIIDDQNGDGVSDLITMYGGDDTKRAREPRSAGYIVLVSGADGAVLARYQTPDGRESYSAVIVYQRADGSPWLIFGTGGETFGGAAYRAPVASLQDGSFAAAVQRLIEPGVKGVMAPAVLVELTGDREVDIILSTFDGRLSVLDGASGQPIWSQHEPVEETYHPPAVMRVSTDGRLGLVVSRAIGVFPNYAGTVHRIHDARDGRILYQYRDPLGPAGAPLAVDLNGDGIDEPFFFASRGRIHVQHGASGALIVHDLPAHLSATPIIADPRHTGSLELIGATWENANEGQGVANWRDLSCRLMRLTLDARTPAYLSWAGYMGTTLDGHYRPATPNNDNR